MAKPKFEFGIDFQELIIQYTVTDPKGFKLLQLYEDKYFTLIHHCVIVSALKKYYKKHKKLPEEPYLREIIRVMYSSNHRLFESLLEEDREKISEIVTRIYKSPVKSPEEVVSKTLNFARFVRFKEEMESVDINNYDSYEAKINSLKKANNIGFELQENYGTFLVGGMKDRAHKRDISHLICPTPFYQLNNLLNSGGTTRGSVMVIMSKEKRFKTGFLINTARGFLKMRKKGVYIDLENGEDALTVRSEQSILNETQEPITKGDYDDRLLKILRRYRRIGAELIIKKFPALTSTTDDYQIWLDKLWQDFGFKPDFAIVDYGMIQAAVSGKTEDFGRISDSFLDLKNFASHNNLESLWTAVHITREADKRTGTKYKSTDIAKCIDIPKHVDAVLGLQESEEEMRAGVMRLEVIEQRNGMREGNCLFWVDIPRQRMKEFKKAELRDYHDQIRNAISNYDESQKPKKNSDL